MENQNTYLFNNDEEFQLLIGDSLAYKNLQNQVSKLVGFVRPNYLIEFGSGSGATSIRLARENPHTSIVAVDLREKLVGDSAELVKKKRIRNVTFVNADLTKLDNFNLKNCNLILMLFSFKYITDPLKNKVSFLTELYGKMQKGAYVIIADTFIDNDATKQNVKKQFEQVFYNSSKDSYWKNLNGISEEEINKTLHLQSEIREYTKQQAEIFASRDGVYPVSIDWMFSTLQNIGYKIVIGEKLNSVNDAIFLLQK